MEMTNSISVQKELPVLYLNIFVLNEVSNWCSGKRVQNIQWTAERKLCPEEGAQQKACEGQNVEKSNHRAICGTDDCQNVTSSVPEVMVPEGIEDIAPIEEP